MIDWRFNGLLITYEKRVGTRGLAEYAALLERIKAGGHPVRGYWPDFPRNSGHTYTDFLPSIGPQTRA